MTLKKNIHFIGICGTAMGNVAIGLKNEGHSVTGSDKGVYPPISDLLKKNDVEILEFDENNVKNSDLVVIGNAIPRGNLEVEYVLNNKIKYCSLPVVLNTFFLKDKKLILITGTHGKTTTTSLIVHVLKELGLNPSYMVGGIPSGFDTGFNYNKDSEYFVMEGDEYDTAFFDKTSKFLKFSPDYLVVNYIEFDHADIFDNLNDIKKTFKFLLKRTSSESTIFLNIDDENTEELKNFSFSKLKTFGFSDDEFLKIKKIEYREGKSLITFETNKKECSFSFILPGNHNARNAAAAFMVAREIGLETDDILKSLTSFKGVGRRMELKAKNLSRDIEIYEDFAHHPTAIKETLEGVKKRFSKNRIFVVFEPATNTIRSGFFKESLFDALNLADFAMILPVPKKKKQGAIDTFDNSLFKGKDKYALVENIMDFKNVFVQNLKSGDIVIFMSNGSLQGTLNIALQAIKE